MRCLTRPKGDVIARCLVEVRYCQLTAIGFVAHIDLEDVWNILSVAGELSPDVGAMAQYTRIRGPGASLQVSHVGENPAVTTTR